MLGRREFLVSGGRSSLAVTLAALGLGGAGAVRCGDPRAPRAGPSSGARGDSAARPDADPDADPRGALTLFLAGDVMTGRGIDQILPDSVDPVLHEPYVRDARDYVRLAERVNGPIPDEVDYDYVWGDTLAELERALPDARIVNLETAVTTSDAWWPEKDIHYRMHPANVPLLRAAGIDVCVLGNNHVLDWGHPGLTETLASLRAAGLRTAGAGADLEEAAAPARVETARGRLLVFSLGARGAGIPSDWAARARRAGVHLLRGFGVADAGAIAEHVRAFRRAGDRVVLSLHCGSNWGYDVPAAHRAFAHALIDEGVVDVVHGHSSHHPKPIEVYRGRTILYGCGDFINDYEGISGREEFRSELTAMYLPRIARGGELLALILIPMRIERFRLQRARGADARWLAERLDRESRAFGTRVVLDQDDRLRVEWD